MSNSSPMRVPSYRRHKPSGQAVVSLSGTDYYLGRWSTKASRAEYDRLIGQWMAAGRCLPDVPSGPSVAELALAYWQFAKSHYRKDGRLSGSIHRIRVALRALRESYGPTLAREFGPLALQSLRQTFIDSGNSRRYINSVVDVIRRVFKWGASQELLPVDTYRALATVAGLRKGRSAAREAPPIGPVADEVVDATLPDLSEVVADMVRLQRLTGCRPGEVCIVRPCDVDMAEDVWLYRPESHKTQHHGRGRVICIGPKGQDVLRPYLLREKTAYCLQPIESERKRLAELHQRRKTPLSCGNRSGTNRRRNPKKRPGNRYDTGSYRRAIHRACDKVGVERWSPNRLRHSAGTAIRKQYGLEAAQVTLGHATADVTQVYAERDLTLATEIMRKIG